MRLHRILGQSTDAIRKTHGSGVGHTDQSMATRPLIGSKEVSTEQKREQVSMAGMDRDNSVSEMILSDMDDVVDTAFSCVHCDRPFLTRLGVRHHQSYCVKKESHFKCRICTFKSDHASSVRRHAAAVHDTPASPVEFDCPYC